MKQRADDIKLLLEAVMELGGNREMTSNFGITEVGTLRSAPKKQMINEGHRKSDYDSWKTKDPSEDDSEDEGDDIHQGSKDPDYDEEKPDFDDPKNESKGLPPWLKKKGKDDKDKELLTDEDEEPDDSVNEESSMSGGSASGTMSISKKNQKPSTGEVDDEKESSSKGKSSSSGGSSGGKDSKDTDRGKGHMESPLPPPWLKRGDLYETVLKSVKSVINEIGNTGTIRGKVTSPIDSAVQTLAGMGIHNAQQLRLKREEIIGRYPKLNNPALLSQIEKKFEEMATARSGSRPKSSQEFMKKGEGTLFQPDEERPVGRVGSNIRPPVRETKKK